MWCAMPASGMPASSSSASNATRNRPASVALVQAERVEDGAQAVEEQHVGGADVFRPPRANRGVEDVERRHLAA